MSDFEKLKSQALRILARRDHSLAELKLKLRQKRQEFTAQEFEELVAYLKEYKYLSNPVELASRWIKHWNAESRGKLWICGKLRQKNLPVPNIFDDEVELEKALIFAKKKASFPKEKLARTLSSRGFTTEVISKVLKTT